MVLSEFKRLVEELREGIEAGGFVVKAAEPKRGRFREEFNLEVFAQEGKRRERLLITKVFTGRGPYRPWVEIFGINPRPLGRNFFDTKAERILLDRFGEITGRLFIEYFEDRITALELKKGVPPALSRLGFELARRGFTLVRDWYIPEGLMEGGHKLQGEKPPSEEVQKRRLERLRTDLEEFLSGSPEKGLRERVLERFKILVDSWKEFYGTS